MRRSPAVAAPSPLPRRQLRQSPWPCLQHHPLLLRCAAAAALVALLYTVASFITLPSSSPSASPWTSQQSPGTLLTVGDGRESHSPGQPAAVTFDGTNSTTSGAAATAPPGTQRAEAVRGSSNATTDPDVSWAATPRATVDSSSRTPVKHAYDRTGKGTVPPSANTPRATAGATPSIQDEGDAGAKSAARTDGAGALEDATPPGAPPPPRDVVIPTDTLLASDRESRSEKEEADDQALNEPYDDYDDDDDVGAGDPAAQGDAGLDDASRDSPSGKSVPPPVAGGDGGTSTGGGVELFPEAHVDALGRLRMGPKPPVVANTTDLHAVEWVSWANMTDANRTDAADEPRGMKDVTQTSTDGASGAGVMGALAAAQAAAGWPPAVRALSEEGCVAMAAREPMQHLRIRHKPVPVEGLDDAATGSSNRSADIDPKTYKFPFHVPDKPGTMTYADMQWCPGSLEPPPEEVPPIDPAIRALFVIGAQKAGTTWLHNVFSKHPGFVQGETRIKSRQGKNYKELQFFNAWPARSTEEFLSMWPQGHLAGMRNGKNQKFLFDASPEYLLNAAVAPRMKQMVPQAKIVIVLRDPTDRAFSSWSMIADRNRFCDRKKLPLSRLCVERSFEDTFTAWHGSHADRPECRFTTPGSNATWGSCFGCRYNLFSYQECCAAREKHGDALFPCFGVQRGFSVMDYSSYAAQIAWWLQFFPPEQIYIVTSDVLHDTKKRVKVLNELLDFAGLPRAPRFQPQQVNRASAFEGGYHEASPADVAAKAAVSRFHTPQVRDLRALLARFFPHVDLAGFAE